MTEGSCSVFILNLLRTPWSNRNLSVYHSNAKRGWWRLYRLDWASGYSAFFFCL